MKISLSGFVVVSRALAAVAAVFALAALSPAATAQTAPAPAPPTTAPAAGHAPATFDQYQGRTIEEVKIVGNATVPAAVIRNLLGTRQGEKFDPATVEEDYHRIYDLKKFANIVPEVEPTATGVVVIYQVTEQRAITAIRFRGNTNADTSTLMDKIEIKVGHSIDPFRINLARLAIERYYRDENYPFAHVEIVPDVLHTDGVLVFSIVEGPKVRVRSIDFPGNHSFTDGKLKDQIKSRTYIFILQAGTFDSDQVDDDVAALRTFYKDHGFFDARVGRKVSFSADQSECTISFVIDEGVRYSIASVRFDGNHPPHTTAALREHLKIVEGKTYDAEAIQHDLREIVRSYGPGYIYDPNSDNPGYLVVRPVEVFHKEAGKVDLVYHIREGGKFRIADVVVKGNGKIADKVFRRELRVSPGDWYDSATLADAVDRIRALRLTDNVSITPIGDDPNYRTVLVDVSESQTAMFMIGAGFSSNTGILGQISYEQRNFDIMNFPTSLDEVWSRRAFTGAGQYFRLTLQPGTEVSTARLQWEEPYLFDQPYSFSSDLFYQTWIRENYDEVHTGAKFALGKRLTPNFTASISLRAEDVDIDHVLNESYRPLEILDAEGQHTITGAGFNLRYVNTDSPILPTHGYNVGFSYERVGALGGQYNFNKFSADGSTYQLISEDLLSRKTTLAEHVAISYENPDGPFWERFYGGGIGDVLGFRYRGIGPRAGIEQDPIGGDFQLISSVELNFPLVGDSLRGVTFIDAGTVEKDVEITTIRSSIGVGIRLSLPFLGQVPLALNFAVPVTRGRYDNTQVVSFSLGLAP